MSAQHPSPIFHDPTGRRWPRLRRALTALAALATVVFAVFVASVLVNPFLPRLNLPQIAGLPRAVSAPALPRLPARTARTPAASSAVSALRRAEAAHPVRRGHRPSVMPVAPPPAAGPSPRPAPTAPPPGAPAAHPVTAAFYVNWDDASYASLARNLARLDWVIPEWARLRDDATDPVTVDVDPRALDLVRRERPQARLLPMVQNFRDGDFDGALLARVLGDAAARAHLAEALTRLVERLSAAGVVIDFEAVPAETHPALAAFVGALRAAFAPRGWIVAQAVPFDDPQWSLPTYAAASDYLLLMGYDEHAAGDGPGPVASRGWFERTLAARLAELDPARTIVCVGGYGYDWSNGAPPGRDVSFDEAMTAARAAHAAVAFDPATGNPVVRFADAQGTTHELWFLDAVTAYNQIRTAVGRGVAGVALWRLGSEDPSLWAVLDAHARTGGAAVLREVTFPYGVVFDGAGELLDVVAEPARGERALTMEPGTELIAGERYDALPSSYVIRRTGGRAGLVALTFDDGPDPVFTPALLDVLAREHAPATFFIIGENGAANLPLLRRIVAEGHDLGNHTYTHPNLGEVPDAIVALELNATQRLIESATGRSTTLFRPPFFGDAEPRTPDQVRPVAEAERLGYVTVGLEIDGLDWQRPGIATIVRRVVEGATALDPAARGQVVLLHDGGGDRAQTVAAVPEIVQTLRARGFQFVTVSQLAGLPRDRAMPPVPPGERVYAWDDEAAFYLLGVGGWLLRWVFAVGLVLGVGRALVVTSLAVAQAVGARRAARAPADAPPRVTVLVPAFNEERVIARTIESLLASRYPDFEVLVVDDGSRDQTAAVVRAAYGDEPRVRLFTKPNGGKADSLNYGLARATGAIVVALDADTVFPPEVLGELVAPLAADARVGAVAGNAKVGNRINLVTRWQALEYITSQNLDRRAFALLNCITVVPGAVGAWRRDVLEQLGGFQSDTLAEDQDLTLKVLRRGYRIAYAPRAVAWTEAPDTLRALAKQRFRWSFGTLQCMWKHRDALLRPRYGALGLVAMPNVWLFQLALPLLAPLMDLLVLVALATAAAQRMAQPAEYTAASVAPLLFYYALFQALEVLSAAAAFALERKESWRLLGWLMLQRFCYRQLMYYVIYKSVLAAARGGRVGWGKLERKATVAPPS